ncbi:MAG: high-potential iron-sulfur protein [Nevskia sp.]|nr:high-potential iron-sulfur protein [Nevskia sp.]
MSQPLLDRRRFLSRIALGAAALPLLNLAPAQAADLPHLDPSDPTAKALAYTNDASSAKSDSVYKAGSMCSKCALFTAPASGDWGACGAFAGKSVNKNGWCRAFAAKA